MSLSKKKLSERTTERVKGRKWVMAERKRHSERDRKREKRARERIIDSLPIPLHSISLALFCFFLIFLFAEYIRQS